jgi:hypothetical protein
MKTTKLVKIVGIAAAVAMMNVNAGQPEAAVAIAPVVSVMTGYSSEDVWRGASLGQDEANAVLSTETALPADIALTLSADYSAADSDVKDEQTDLSAVFSKQVSDYLVSLSYIWYSQDVALGGGQAQEAGVSVSRSLGPVDISLTQYLGLVGDNNSYSELSATYSDDFGSSILFDFRSELGYLAQEGQCTHFETRISTDIPVTQGVVAVPFVAYSLGLDDSVGIHSDMSNLFFGGIEFKRSF